MQNQRSQFLTHCLTRYCFIFAMAFVMPIFFGATRVLAQTWYTRVQLLGVDGDRGDSGSNDEGDLVYDPNDGIFVESWSSDAGSFTTTYDRVYDIATSIMLDKDGNYWMIIDEDNNEFNEYSVIISVDSFDSDGVPVGTWQFNVPDQGTDSHLAITVTFSAAP